MHNSISVDRLILAYGATTVIDGIDLRIPNGKITVLIGSNGCGKSTLLRSLARLLKPQQGTIMLDGRAIAQMTTKEVARRIAVLPQNQVLPEALTVLQLVRLGRYPHQAVFKQWSEEDENRVEEALRLTGMSQFANRAVDSLSGGQRQRAWIAMTLAQNTDILLLDEPTTYLDLSYQVEILDLLYKLNQQDKRTIVMVLHDLNLSCRYAHHMVAVSEGKIYAQGCPEDIMTRELVQNVFQMECEIGRDMLYGTPVCVPYSKGRNLSPQLDKAGNRDVSVIPCETV
ncbi:ABC transporter ATP-binding protein [Shouchella rhizosphaerae]|uniref:ABC transporter ATP-binding protein n=1 Tax=Shouchella rhizosphaerae TaxID=866786 RepID=UPI003F7F72CA